MKTLVDNTNKVNEQSSVITHTSSVNNSNNKKDNLNETNLATASMELVNNSQTSAAVSPLMRKDSSKKEKSKKRDPGQKTKVETITNSEMNKNCMPLENTSNHLNDQPPPLPPARTQDEIRNSVLNFQKQKQKRSRKRKRVERFGHNAESNYDSDSSIEITTSVASPWDEAKNDKKKKKKKKSTQSKVRNMLDKYEKGTTVAGDGDDYDKDDEDEYVPGENDESDDDDDDGDNDITAEASRKRRLEDIHTGNNLLQDVSPVKQKARKGGRRRRKAK